MAVLVMTIFFLEIASIPVVSIVHYPTSFSNHFLIFIFCAEWTYERVQFKWLPEYLLAMWVLLPFDSQLNPLVYTTKHIAGYLLDSSYSRALKAKELIFILNSLVSLIDCHYFDYFQHHHCLLLLLYLNYHFYHNPCHINLLRQVIPRWMDSREYSQDFHWIIPTNCH